MANAFNLSDGQLIVGGLLGALSLSHADITRAIYRSANIVQKWLGLEIP